VSVGTAHVIDGKAIAEGIRDDVARRIGELVAETGRNPGLATILIGDDPASAVYIAAKRRACGQVGIHSFHHELPNDARREEVLTLIDALNADPRVSGILCQLPLPAHLDATEITNRITPDKDVDGLTVASAGRLALGLDGLRPCTPSGAMHLLEEAGVELRGALAVVLGRSNLFGKPMAQMLLAADATVIACHSRTAHLTGLCRQADVLVVAVGRPGMVTADCIKPGATIVDVGINRTIDGLVGDVDFDGAAPVAGAITPVPGGVGPMTIACLLRNTLRAATALDPVRGGR
jgi:methylenetetrahydrofolate dehydrogenase (NADP+)/methenyltetrahydrofolate cyclohydrolase